MSDQIVTKHKVVSITYRILDEQGQLVEQSDIPIDYIHGADNDMFAKVEQALEGKTVGDTVEVVLPPEDGFGHVDPNMTFIDDIENVPPEYRHVGARPMFQNEHGDVTELVVSKIENGKLTVDGNHPFAGKTMTFNVDVIAIRDATEEELAGGPSVVPPDQLH
ncbi:MAG: peptidylprolyl isomerase [Gammaproteobacteria bacterium SG8_11]|nr:MAG: peptidylprolyl isomerase [Gammaproteobacteria bacterium SG8_11]